MRKDRKYERIRRQREKINESFHEEMVEKILENPNLLNEKWEVLWKAQPKSPELALGSSPDRETIDLLFLAKLPTRLEIILGEIKVGTGSYAWKGAIQLEIAKKYFRKNWKKWLREKIEGKLELMEKSEVWLISLLLYCQPLEEIKNSILREKERKLGEIILTANGVRFF